MSVAHVGFMPLLRNHCTVAMPLICYAFRSSGWIVEYAVFFSSSQETRTSLFGPWTLEVPHGVCFEQTGMLALGPLPGCGRAADRQAKCPSTRLGSRWLAGAPWHSFKSCRPWVCKRAPITWKLRECMGLAEQSPPTI